MASLQKYNKTIKTPLILALSENGTPEHISKK
jgi:hypothetical protein